MRSLLLCAWAVVLALHARAAANAGQELASGLQSGVDQTAVLRVGGVEFSHYALEKNFRWFQQSVASWRTPPVPSEVEHWLGGFLAERLLIAHALSLGYGTRPEVERTVANMERYMLTQSNGPFYERLYARLPPLPAETTRQWYEASRHDIEVAALEFPALERTRLLGPDWSELSQLQRLARLREVPRQSPTCTLFEGRLPWPYHPVGNLQGASALAVPEAWHEHTEESAGTSWIFFVKRVLSRQQPDYDAHQSEFDRWVNQLRQQEYRRQRQLAVLKKADFVFDAALASEVMRHLTFLPDNQVALSASAPTGLHDAPLCRYRIDARDESLTVDRWIALNNSELVRMAPHELSALKENVRNLVLAEFDSREAQQLGVQCEAKFIEDKRNFLCAQVLSLFEKERFPQALAVSEDEVEAYFEEHQNQITVPRERARFFIRQAVARDHLAPLKLKLAQEIASRLKIEDRIPYARYGVDRSAAPWFRSESP